MAGYLGQLTGWKALAVGVAIVGFIGARVAFSTPRYRDFDSGTWNIPARQSMAFEIKTMRSCKLQFELTRTTPGPFHVALLDEANHRRVQATPPHLDLPPDIAMIFKQDANTTLSLQDIQVGTGTFFLYTDNSEDVPITVKYRVAEYR